MTPVDAREEQAHEAWDAGDLPRAFQLFRSCAYEGLRSAMMNLGFFYDEGLGTPASKHLAKIWYRKARHAGDFVAANNLAILFRERHAHRSTFHWFRKAALDGDGDAWIELAKCHLKGTGTSLSAARARECLRRAMRSRFITPAGREEAQTLLRVQGVLQSLSYRRS
ncbi:hypothetical protein ASF11_02410 [Acidovorax sp. Leaf76]|uniref:tetratricopeptide repeat protein n=1 Tax=unclassified Acidovorax TaxID=2684926 RepID=UPI0006FB590B|nr:MULTISPECIES: SEL1-like repeat protein [unclassified Acidovorax]KQO26563.1 hypothetical protein ASF11_02410 [Acidovorax sp. Leaf76]KQO40338.1 hypothetical protein ASF19_01450 [Acidovorax sp. Leaf84]KQS42476.1 hypothetical protein ASG27_01385 [Acidovorax sp. Leaf191]